MLGQSVKPDHRLALTAAKSPRAQEELGDALAGGEAKAAVGVCGDAEQPADRREPGVRRLGVEFHPVKPRDLAQERDGADLRHNRHGVLAA